MKIVNKVFDMVTVLLFVAMLVTILLQIIFRYLLKISVPWTEELSRLLFIYVGFFGTALAARDKQFIIIDVLLKRLPKMVQVVLQVIIKVAVLLFFAIMLVGAVQMYDSVKDTYFQSIPGVSKGVSYIAVIIGVGMTIVYTVLESIDSIRKRGMKDA